MSVHTYAHAHICRYLYMRNCLHMHVQSCHPYNTITLMLLFQLKMQPHQLRFAL